MTLVEADTLGEAHLYSDRTLCAEIEAIAKRRSAEECRWLELLCEFDRRRAWEADGQICGTDWLVWRCGLGRSTAKEKLRVAHELRRRPLINESFSKGQLSYSKVRAITRIVDMGESTDEALLELARVGTAQDLEQAGRHYEALKQQELGVQHYLKRYERRRLHCSKTYDAMMVIEVVVPIEDGEELMGAINKTAHRPVDKALAGDTLTERRVDALIELVRSGLSNSPTSAGDDRYTLHLIANVNDLNNATTASGEPIGGETVRRLTCDAAIVRHLMKGRSVPLDVGTRTRVWTPGQRRAISLRDRYMCRFPGCSRTTCDVHHVVHYADGGPTAIDNAILLCPHHHTTVHERHFRMTGDPNATMVFLRPDGTVLDESPIRFLGNDHHL